MTDRPLLLLGIKRSASAPDFSQWYNYETERRLEEEKTLSSFDSERSLQEHDELPADYVNSPEPSGSPCQPPIHVTAETQTHRFPTEGKAPSTLAFRSYVYVLVGIQVGVASLQWLATTYHWQPKFSSAERKIYMLILLLTWCNVSLGFLGFRRLQVKFPLNWIIFFCIFESLTLFILCLCVYELDLTWPFMVVGVSVLVIYTLLGLWVPALLTADLWILIFASLSVLIAAVIAMSAGLAMRFYVPLTVCMIIFGPWAMYNSQNIHHVQRRGYCTRNYLTAAMKVYINYGWTVGTTVLVYRIAVDSIEDEGCKSSILCGKRSIYPLNE